MTIHTSMGKNHIHTIFQEYTHKHMHIRACNPACSHIHTINIIITTTANINISNDSCWFFFKLVIWCTLFFSSYECNGWLNIGYQRTMLKCAYSFVRLCSFFLPVWFIIIIINPLTARVVGALQMILQPVFSIFPCSPLPSGTCRTQGLSISWCCLPTSSSVCLVFFPFSLCLARWFWPDLMNGRHDHTTAVCVSLRSSGGLRVVQLPAGSWHGLPCWQHGYCIKDTTTSLITEVRLRPAGSLFVMDHSRRMLVRWGH